MSTRQRKITKQNENKSSEAQMFSLPKRTSLPGGLAKRYLTITLLITIILLGYIAISNDLKPIHLGSKAIDSLAFSFNVQKPIYAVIIDAGSTGTRVHVFAFHASILNGNLVLDRSFFHEEKPGLSSFVDDLRKIEESLNILLSKAKSEIPQAEWHKTSVSLGATAGLRLLPQEKADLILSECRKVFETSGLKISENSVHIMEGDTEGIYSWVTVNFLLDKFNAHNSVGTVAALDLGGGSTQVTYTTEVEDIPKLDKTVYSINAFDFNMSLYTHSFLGFGLMAARKEILTRNNTFQKGEIKENKVVEIRSECINPIVLNKWSYGGVNYVIRGPVNGSHKIVKTQNFAGSDEDRPIVKFQKCMEIIENYVSTLTIKIVGLNKHEIYAFSYYYDRATEAGLIDPFNGGVIELDYFRKAAMETCDYPNTDQPFMCLDLTYIYVLLRHGFKLEPTTKLNLFKKITGYEVSWALGAAFEILQDEF